MATWDDRMIRSGAIDHDYLKPHFQDPLQGSTFLENSTY